LFDSKENTLDIPTIETMHIFPTKISEYIQSHSVSGPIHHPLYKNEHRVSETTSVSITT